MEEAGSYHEELIKAEKCASQPIMMQSMTLSQQRMWRGVILNQRAIDYLITAEMYGDQPIM